jgi:O-antigen/teichoic acid export membrane protein
MSEKGRNHPVHISSRTIVKNTFFNLVGQIIPILAVIVGLPVLIKYLGVERFGLLSILWMMMWYSSMLDLGLGRTTTKFVSELLAQSKLSEIPKIVWSSVSIQIVVGLLIGIILYNISPIVVVSILKVSANYVNETKLAFYFISIAVPLILVSTSLQGVIEAYQRFDIVNFVLITMKLGVLIFSIVGAVLNLGLSGIIFMIVIFRLLIILILGFIDLKLCPELKSFSVDFKTFSKLLSFGGWLTLSNIVIPVLTYVDRFLISYFLSASVLAYYTAPFEIVQRMWIVPVSLTMTLFPAFSAFKAMESQDKLENAFTRAIKYTFLILFPVVFIIVVFSSEILNLWLGADFSARSSVIFQLLSFGFLISSISGFPIILLQSYGRPDLVAKVSLFELLLYLPLVSLLIHKFNLEGAAFGWVLRSLAEGLILFYFVFKNRIVPFEKFYNGELKRLALISIFMFFGIFLLKFFNVAFKLIFSTALLLMFALYIWFFVIDEGEKISIFSFMKTKAIFK